MGTIRAMDATSSSGYALDYFEDSSGRVEVRDFLADLAANHPQDSQKVEALLKVVTSTGVPRNPTKAKRVEGSDGVFEFKSFQVRILWFYHPNPRARMVIVMASAERKKKDKLTPAVVQRAEAARKAEAAAVPKRI